MGRISNALGCIFTTIWQVILGARDDLRSALRENDGTGNVSLSRLMMFVFSCFSMWLIWRIFWHVFRIRDTAAMTIWLSNIPLLIAALCGLIVLPYTINKGSEAMGSAFNGIAQMMAAAKQGKGNAVMDKIEDLANKNKDKNGDGDKDKPAVGGGGLKG